jgi:ADP-ribose pyrophosphatase YjhB (NUDIX family)
MSFEIKKCLKGCCQYKVSPYIYPVNWISDHLWIYSNSQIKKAGGFIYDKSNNKILLVQSRGKYWGPPKGSLNKDEDIISGAKREVKEETGIDFSDDDIQDAFMIKNNIIYFVLNIKESDLSPQNNIRDNDANGIGYFSLDCLKEMLDTNKINITFHCKLLIKKIFGLTF